MTLGISGDTRIAVADGRNFVEIEKLVGSVVPVYCFNGNTIDICWANAIRKVGRKEIFETVLDDETSAFTTKDQIFMLRDGLYCEFRNLKINNSLMPLNKCTYEGYTLTNLNNGNRVQEHRLFLECKLGRNLLPHPEEVTHHVNENRQNNRWDNLEIMSKSEHSSLHSTNMSLETRVKISNAHLGKRHSAETRAKISNTFQSVPIKEREMIINQTRRTKILIQAKWMMHNGHPLVPVYWNTYKEKFFQETTLKGCWYKTAMKYFGTQEELIKALGDNHKVKEVYHVGVEDVYTMYTNVGNFAILTSDMSGIILGSK